MIFNLSLVGKLRIFPLLILPFISSAQLPTYSFEGISNNKLILADNSNIIDNNILKSEYILDSNDILSISFNGLEIFSNLYKINLEGYLYLPELGQFYAAGYTIKELKQALEERYEKYIIEPRLTISINEYRPVSIYLTGEVRNPGLYTIANKSKFSVPERTSSSNTIAKSALPSNPTGNNMITASGNNMITASGNNMITAFDNKDKSIPDISTPKLFNALQLAEGVTVYADLANIKIVRKNSKTQGGGKIQTNINLMKLITDGDQSQNIRLFDGDSIFIPKSEKPIKAQVLSIYNSNLSSNEITVFVTGNVQRPGPTRLKKGSSLIQAIASNGGKQYFTGNVEFIRFNDDGSTDKRKFNFNPKAKKNSEKNPILMDGDIINVNRNLLGKTARMINEISTPIVTSYGVYKIFE